MSETLHARQLGRDADEHLHRAAKSRWLDRLARLGLAARGGIYVLVGWLAVQVALGHSNHETDQNGALKTLAGHPFGAVVLWLLALGFAGYALWRFTEVRYGETGGDGGATGRVKSLFRGLVYAGLCVTTVSIVTGAGNPNRGSAAQDTALSARLMRHAFGRWLIGLIGVALVMVGVALALEGWERKFERHLRMAEMGPQVRRWVERLGVVGTIARGAVFAIAGVLVVDAAVTFDPSKARGLDGALRGLAQTSVGPPLLGILAVGLLAFGAYGFAEARYRRT